MADGSEDLDHEFSFKLFAGLLAGILTSVLLIGIAVAEKTPLTFYEAMTAIGVLASITLTGTLAYLYYRMSQIQDLQREGSERQADLQRDLAENQEKQNELLELQQEMRELEYQPKLLIDEYEIKSTGVELKIRNLGRGLAEHIAVRPNFHIPNIPESHRVHDPEAASDDILHAPDEVFYRDPDTGTEYFPMISPAVRTEGEEFMSKRRCGGMLSPDEDAVTFISQIQFASADPGQNGFSGVFPSQFFSELYGDGIREIRFYLDLVYCNELGEVFVSPIMGRSGELSENTALDNIEKLRYGSTGTRGEVKENVEANQTYPPPR